MRTPTLVLALGILALPTPIRGQVAISGRDMKSAEAVLARQSRNLDRTAATLAHVHVALAAAQVRQAAIHSRLQGQLAPRQVQTLRLRSQAMAQARVALERAGLPGGPLAPTRIATAPPVAWAIQDPADSLYRRARQALNRNDYWQAVDLFRSLRDRYPKSAYAPDAYYWESYGLYRRGSADALRMALEALAAQERLFPKAGTRESGDARSLETRIRSELARSGDAGAALAIATEAQRAAVPPGPRATPAPPAVPAPRAMPAPPAPRAAYSGALALARQRDECRDQEDDIQAVALNALLQMDEERALPILRKVLARRDEASVCLRRKAIFIVGQHEGSDTESILLGVARTDPDAEVRGQAVFWLSQVDSPAAVQALDSILFNSKDPELQEKALFALSQHESVEARQGLRRYAERSDVSPEMREKSLFWLGQSDDPEDAAFLRSMYGRVQDPETKRKILFAVAQSDTKEVGPFLTAIVKNTGESLEVRKQALFWLGQRDETSGADLASVYGTFSDVEIKEHVIFVLAQREDQASMDKLIDIAKREPNQELRKKAIFWLTQTDDPRVVDILAELLEKP